MSRITIDACGPAVTVQDGGRFGWEHCGVTQGGAVDGAAYRLGQRLVDNPGNSAALEIPWGGLTLTFTDQRRIALTGARVPISLNGESHDLLAETHPTMNTAMVLPKGSTLSLGRPETGVWSYLSIEGGINTPPVFSSRSTVLRESLGGLAGRALAAGDELPLGPAREGQCYNAPPSIPKRRSPLSLRLVTGFQFSDMPPAAREALLSHEYQVSARSDRMGSRLEGPAIETGMARLWSEGTCLGAVQIPPDGQPIVLLNDRQTMGGYPKAGAILSSDCARLAQLRPGDRIRFTAISPTEADRALWLQANYEQEQVLLPCDSRPLAKDSR